MRALPIDLVAWLSLLRRPGIGMPRILRLGSSFDPRTSPLPSAAATAPVAIAGPLAFLAAVPTAWPVSLAVVPTASRLSVAALRRAPVTRCLTRAGAVWRAGLARDPDRLERDLDVLRACARDRLAPPDFDLEALLP